MLYQLPGGKVIYLTLEEYLSLDDKELHEIANSGMGEDAPYNTYFVKGSKTEKIIELPPDLDISHVEDGEDEADNMRVDMENLPE